jgi:Protein of unknown function (DUF2794)
VADREPIPFKPQAESQRADSQKATAQRPAQRVPSQVAFDRRELSTILNVYGRMVAAGEWRDYAMDFGREAAVFAVYRRASEVPLYRIEKCPRLARKQGAYAVVSANGLIVKRGHELARVLSVFDKRSIDLVKS